MQYIESCIFNYYHSDALISMLETTGRRIT